MRVAIRSVSFRRTTGVCSGRAEIGGVGAYAKRDLSGKVVRLNLKQASRSWHRHLVARLKSLGFEQSLAGPCVLD